MSELNANVIKTTTIQHTNGTQVAIIGSGGEFRANQIQTTAGLPLLNSTGSIIQVVYGNMGSNTATIFSQDIVSIPNCSVTITPTRSSSQILLTAHVVHGARYVCSLGFTRGGVAIGGNTNTNSSNSIAMEWWSGTTTDLNYVTTTSYNYLDSPATTSSLTYSPAICSSWNGTLYSVTVNDRLDANMRGLTSIVAMEILS